MEWVLILALAVWVWLQSQRIESLSRRLKQVEERGSAPGAALDGAPDSVAPRTPPPAPADQELEPLLLDTPLPEPSNDLDDIPAPEASRETAAPPRLESADVLELHTLAPPEEKPPSRAFEQWLAANGFAWIGGALLACGGLFLVAYAAEQDFFTPPLRLGAAFILGLVLIGAAEWVRRSKNFTDGRQNLVGALLAGAGAATLYATAWAAHGLYHFIDGGTAAALMSLCAILLIVLSHVHGQALGGLAIGAGLLAPALASSAAWPSLALTFYICAVGATGFILALLRRWAWTAGVALVGLYAWFAVCIGADEIYRALMVVSVASLGATAAALRPPVDDGAGVRLSWRQAHALLPTAAICMSSVFLLWTWLSIAPVANASLAGPALVAILHVGLAALAVRRRFAEPAAFAVAIGALAVGLLMYMRARAYFAPGGQELYLWPLLGAGAVGLAALGAKPDRHGRVLVAGAGAVGAAVLIAFAAFSRPVWSSLAVWAPLFLGGALLLVGAHLASRNSRTPHADWSVDFWTLAGAALILIGMESFAPAAPRPAGDAAISLLFAALLAWRGWRGAGYGALAAAALTLAHALAPDFSGMVMNGQLSLVRALLFLAAATAFLFGAAEMAARQATAKSVSEALSASAILVVLLGVFLGLRWLASGGAAVPLDSFVENALRALALICAGYIALPRKGAAPGFISRTRGHVLIGLGLLIALLGAGLTQNPWWGENPAGIVGPPLLNAQALALAAPAALAFSASRRLYMDQRFAARAYASVGGALAAGWIIVELRRAFHGADMAPAEIGVFEGACYALAALAGALAIAIAKRLRANKHAGGPFTADLARITHGAAFAGVAIAALLMLITRNPWWGGQNPALSTTLMSGLAIASQAVAVTLALVLGRALSIAKAINAARFTAACAAALFALSFGHLAIRFLHHGGAMDDNVELIIGLEGFAHALWPLLFVLIASELTARTPGRDTVRAYLYDLQAIWGAAIWPALVFAALALWLIFNPWWGLAPAFVDTNVGAALGLAALLMAAWLSFIAPRVPHLRFRPLFERAALLACIGHCFVAVSLSIRRTFHGADMRAVIQGASLETWAYSAAWAAFGAGLVALGMMRRDPVLRWSGLVLLMLDVAKVMLFDTATLSGVLRAISILGLGAIVMGVALAVRRFGLGAQGSRD